MNDSFDFMYGRFRGFPSLLMYTFSLPVKVILPPWGFEMLSVLSIIELGLFWFLDLSFGQYETNIQSYGQAMALLFEQWLQLDSIA